MAKRPLYDLLPRNSEIHNFISVYLTDRQKRIIGLGLKFRPTQEPADLTQFNMQIQDFCRSVRLHKIRRRASRLGLQPEALCEIHLESSA